jgi:hypothetical protein
MSTHEPGVRPLTKVFSDRLMRGSHETSQLSGKFEAWLRRDQLFEGPFDFPETLDALRKAAHEWNGKLQKGVVGKEVEHV